VNIAVVLRQVPDLIEPLEVAASGVALDLSSASFLLNESDDHALEQALLLKEAVGGSVTVIALDFGDVDNTLYAAAAKGADRIIKLAAGSEGPLPLAAAAAIYAGAIKPLGCDLVLVGVQAHDELEGVLPPLLAQSLGLPYVGVIRGVKLDAGAATVWKEFPGAVMERLKVKLPAVLGIVGAEQPPRYVPVARIRAAMKSTQFDEQDAVSPALEAKVTVGKLYPPASGSRAEILSGSESEVAARIAKILVEKGLVK
jgi:electron transfer flavoprotein beta subunit